MIRALFAITGLAALAWGGWLAWDFATSSTKDGIQALAWFAGGPILHDAVIAPAVGIIGLLLARTPLKIGALLTGILVLLAIPLLWRPVGVPSNPGLHDRNYAAGLAIALGVCWLGVLLAATLPGFARQLRRRKAEATRGRARG